MAYLFQVLGQTVTPNTETLLLYPFNKIWERDRSKNKSVARSEFAYIEFMSSQLKSNPFRNYKADKKEAKIIQAAIKQKNWQPDTLVKIGIEAIKSFQKEASTIYRLYLASKRAVEETEAFLNSFSYEEINEKSGAQLYKPKDILAIVKTLNDSLQTLMDMEDKVQQELFEVIKNKGGKTVSSFANPDILKEI